MSGSNSNTSIELIQMIGCLIYTVLTFFQVAVSLVFYIRSRKVKEINWLPKFVMVLTNVVGLTISIFFVMDDIFMIHFEEEVDEIIVAIGAIIFPILFALIIRF